MEEFDACIQMISRLRELNQIAIAILLDERYGGVQKVEDCICFDVVCVLSRNSVGANPSGERVSGAALRGVYPVCRRLSFLLVRAADAASTVVRSFPVGRVAAHACRERVRRVS